MEGGALSQHPPLPLPHHSFAYPRRRIWRVCHCLVLRSSPAVKKIKEAQVYWEEKLTKLHLLVADRGGSDLFHSLILRCGSAVVRVFLRAHFCALAHICTILFVLVRQLLYMTVGLAAAQSPNRAGQPLTQGISWSLGSWRTLRTHHVPRLQSGR